MEATLLSNGKTKTVCLGLVTTHTHLRPPSCWSRKETTPDQELLAMEALTVCGCKADVRCHTLTLSSLIEYTFLVTFMGVIRNALCLTTPWLPVIRLAYNKADSKFSIYSWVPAADKTSV